MLGLGFESQANRNQAGARLFEDPVDSRVGACSDDAVDLRDQRAQLLAVALGKATGDDQTLTGSLGGGLLENRIGRFGLGRIDERARVHDHGVGLARLGDEFPAFTPELRDHDLGVDQVLRAAQADKGDSTR